MNESINDALIACVKACGGSKQVGPLLWPEKAPDAAQRLLLDCLNPDRAAHLTPEQMLLVLRMARDRSHHEGMAFIASALSYTMPVPTDPRDEAAELQRRFIATFHEMKDLVDKMGQLPPQPVPHLRSAA